MFDKMDSNFFSAFGGSSIDMTFLTVPEAVVVNDFFFFSDVIVEDVLGVIDVLVLVVIVVVILAVVVVIVVVVAVVDVADVLSCDTSDDSLLRIDEVLEIILIGSDSHKYSHISLW